MRVTRWIFALATALSLSCAAIAGLDDFEIVACADDCAEDASSADVTAPPAPSSPPPAADADRTPLDSAVSDAAVGPPLLPGDAALVVPACAGGTCPKIGGACSAEPCNATLMWTLGQGGGEYDNFEGFCLMEGDPGDQVFLGHTIDGGARYEFDLHFDLMEISTTAYATIAVIDFGNEQALLQYNGGTFQLCNHTACTPGPVMKGTSAKIDLYGLAGEGVASGIVQLVVGTNAATCAGGTSISLATPVTAAPTARVGCLGAGGASDSGDDCEDEIDNLTFSVLNL